jgi:DNA-binding MarR family transcriptional regulator
MARAGKTKFYGNEAAALCLSLQLYFRASERYAREAGLTITEYDLILALSALPHNAAPNIALLCDRLLSYHHVASTTVARLIKKDLLTSERNPSDMRSVVLRLTVKGRELLRTITFRSIANLRERGPDMLDSLVSVLGGVDAAV